MLQECWHENPAVRLSALRMKKSFGALQKCLPEYEYASAAGGSRNPTRYQYNNHGKLVNISQNSSGAGGTMSSGYQSKASSTTNSARHQSPANRLQTVQTDQDFEQNDQS